MCHNWNRCFDIRNITEVRHASKKENECYLQGLYEGVKEVLSDEQNRQAIATLTRNWWSGKVAPGIRKKWDDIKEVVHGVKSGETKASALLKEKKNQAADAIDVVYSEIDEADTNGRKHTIVIFL
ncbi:MAG: hypothetical protein PHE02_07460 [Lachnospiraceae bacterium]|nr:hypothetical protein [Lachnospiraceae bacterium]